MRDASDPSPSASPTPSPDLRAQMLLAYQLVDALDTHARSDAPPSENDVASGPVPISGALLRTDDGATSATAIAAFAATPGPRASSEMMGHDLAPASTVGAPGFVSATSQVLTMLAQMADAFERAVAKGERVHLVVREHARTGRSVVVEIAIR